VRAAIDYHAGRSQPREFSVSGTPPAFRQFLDTSIRGGSALMSSLRVKSSFVRQLARLGSPVRRLLLSRGIL